MPDSPETLLLTACLTRNVVCGAGFDKTLSMNACIGRKVTVTIEAGEQVEIDPFEIGDDDCPGFASLDLYHVIFLVNNGTIDVNCLIPGGPFGEALFILDGGFHRSAASRVGWNRTAPFRFSNSHGSNPASITLYLAKSA